MMILERESEEVCVSRSLYSTPKADEHIEIRQKVVVKGVKCRL